eukprot:g13984.t1
MDWGYQQQLPGSGGGGGGGCSNPAAQHELQQREHQEHQQQQLQPRAVAAGGGGGNINQTLDDAIDRFSGMTLGNTGADMGQIVQHRGGVGGVDGLDMGALRVADEGAGAGFGHPDHQANGGMERPQPLQFNQQELGLHRPEAAATAGAGGAGACCPSCGGGGQQGLLPGGGRDTARRGPDGAWLDESGRRLYTEAEVREAIEQEGSAWRDKAASLERSLATMESEAKAALSRAEQTNADLAEQLSAAEGKTYALSVHLAQTNRPSHLA